MGLNKGQLYEKNLFGILKKAGKIPNNVTKIEHTPGQDITVFNSNGESGIEVKNSISAAFGSGTLKFNYESQTPWEYLKKEDDIMKSLVESYNITDIVNKKWHKENSGYQPFYLEEDRKNPIKTITSISRSKRGKLDSESLSEVKINCNKSDIIRYYNSKGSHYIQIYNLGLYTLGNKDPLDIAKHISNFNPTKTFIRVRVQPKGSGKYNFSYGLYISGLQKSKFDLEKNPNINWLG